MSRSLTVLSRLRLFSAEASLISFFSNFFISNSTSAELKAPIGLLQYQSDLANARSALNEAREPEEWPRAHAEKPLVRCNDRGLGCVRQNKQWPDLEYHMGHDKRPKLSPFPVNKSEYQSKRQDHDNVINPFVGVQKCSKGRTGQHCRPRAVCL